MLLQTDTPCSICINQKKQVLIEMDVYVYACQNFVWPYILNSFSTLFMHPSLSLQMKNNENDTNDAKLAGP